MWIGWEQNNPTKDGAPNEVISLIYFLQWLYLYWFDSNSKTKQSVCTNSSNSEAEAVRTLTKQKKL